MYGDKAAVAGVPAGATAAFYSSTELLTGLAILVSVLMLISCLLLARSRRLARGAHR